MTAEDAANTPERSNNAPPSEPRLPVARVLPLLAVAHLDREFDYLVPDELSDTALPGTRVRVRFAGRLVDGFVLARLAESDHDGKLGTLDRLVSPERVLTPEVARLAELVADRYAGTRPDVLRLAVPPRHARVEAETPAAVPDSPPAPDALEWDRYVHGTAYVRALAAGRAPRAAWQALPGEDWARRLAELAGTVAAQGRSAVLLVPDQRDLDRLAAACTAVVGADHVVALAAGLGPAARYRRWLAALRGSARIVVGTRATVFAPVPEVGLVAIWDDGDDTYSEPRAPYPHAREVLLLRAHEAGCAFLAGGFARTAEMQQVVDGGWAHDLLAERNHIRSAAPRIAAPGDTMHTARPDPNAAFARLPDIAMAAIRTALNAEQPVLVQVPRRGYVPALACARCRTPARCRRCHGPLALPGGDRADSRTAAEPTRGTADAGARGASAGAGGHGIDVGKRTATAEDGVRRGARADAGPGRVRDDGPAGTALPTCRWCGVADAAYRCASCGSRALRATVVGAARTAEELGRAFTGVSVTASGGSSVLDEVPAGPRIVVATVGAEPSVPGGYGAALLLDGWALLSRADLRAAEDAFRRWTNAAALVRHSGQVVVVADPALPTVQALVRWDVVGHAAAQLAERAEVHFPPAVRVAAVDGAGEAIATLLETAELPSGTEVLGPVPLPPGARKPFGSDGAEPVEVERMLLRAPRSGGAVLARALAAALRVRSARKTDAPLRVQIDPVDIG